MDRDTAFTCVLRFYNLFFCTQIVITKQIKSGAMHRFLVQMNLQ